MIKPCISWFGWSEHCCYTLDLFAQINSLPPVVLSTRNDMPTRRGVAVKKATVSRFIVLCMKTLLSPAGPEVRLFRSSQNPDLILWAARVYATEHHSGAV